MRKRLCKFNGVAVPKQVAIVSGVQEALDPTARLLLNPGDRVCVENPGYAGAVQGVSGIRREDLLCSGGR